MFRSEKGSRNIVTESNAAARAVISSVRIKGLSSSRMRIVLVKGGPSTAPLSGEFKTTLMISLPSTKASSIMGTTNVLTVSPEAN